MAALNDGAAALELAHRALHHLVRHRAREEDHQVGASHFLAEAAAGLGENFALTLIAVTQVLVAALHTFVAAENDDAHKLLLSLIRVV